MNDYTATYELGNSRFQRAFKADDLTHAAEQAIDALAGSETLCGVTTGLPGTNLATFYQDPPASEMNDQDVIFELVWEDAISQAQMNDIPVDLTSDEMHVFRKCLESGLSCWSEVVELALMAATSERSGS